MNNINKFSILGVFLLISISIVLAYSTYGAPSEFGNDTTTTCYVGGDDGITNCTGNATFANLFGNLSWNYLGDYPVACSPEYAITQLDDAITCTQFAQYQFTDNNFNGSGNFTITGSGTFGDLVVETVGALDPTLTFISANHGMKVYLDESLVNDEIRFEGQTALKNTQITLKAKDGENAVLYLQSGDNFGYINYDQTDRLFIANNKQDENILLQINDGGVTKTITWDAANDKLLHSAGTFNFDDDNIITTGPGVFGGLEPYDSATSDLGSVGFKWRNLFLSGDITTIGIIKSSNVFIPQYIFSHNNATILLATQSVWANITFDQEEPDLKFGISHTYNDATNHTFTIMQDGIYDIEYDMDVVDISGASSDIDVAGRLIYSNGTEIIGSVYEADITKKGIEVEISHTFLAKLNAGDEIVFQFVAEDVEVQISTHGTFGDHPESVSVVIEKIANLP